MPSHVHAALSNGDLGRSFASLEALSAHSGIGRSTEWVRDKPHSHQ
jgi:hypothetical protein